MIYESHSSRRSALACAALLGVALAVSSAVAQESGGIGYGSGTEYGIEAGYEPGGAKPDVFATNAMVKYWF